MCPSVVCTILFFLLESCWCLHYLCYLCGYSEGLYTLVSRRMLIYGLRCNSVSNLTVWGLANRTPPPSSLCRKIISIDFELWFCSPLQRGVT
uniref:Secreted protein n=1 Tax=Anguilla anguilla TaxID=7936 RepID=A0A0E9X8E7_ANGAN